MLKDRKTAWAGEAIKDRINYGFSAINVRMVTLSVAAVTIITLLGLIIIPIHMVFHAIDTSSGVTFLGGLRMLAVIDIAGVIAWSLFRRKLKSRKQITKKQLLIDLLMSAALLLAYTHYFWYKRDVTDSIRVIRLSWGIFILVVGSIFLETYLRYRRERHYGQTNFLEYCNTPQ